MYSTIDPDKTQPVAISIRPVTMPDDLYWLQHWIGVEAQALLPFYDGVDTSGFMQSLMVCDQEVPVLQLDCCQALYDDLGAADLTVTGVYTFRVQLSPDVPAAVVKEGLTNCMVQLLTDQSVNRIMIPVFKEHKPLLDAVKAIGFTWVRQMDLKPPYDIYVYDHAVQR